MSNIKEKLNRFMQPTTQTNCASAALLLLRVVAGVAMILHGWGKIQTPFSWMPPEAPIPGFLQFLAALSEFGGGIALVIGLLTPIAMIGMAITMAVATHMHAIVRGDPFVGSGGPSYELALLYFVIAIMFMIVGPGKYSIDQKIFGNKS
jgi:putative oxidoreductase